MLCKKKLVWLLLEMGCDLHDIFKRQCASDEEIRRSFTALRCYLNRETNPCYTLGFVVLPKSNKCHNTVSSFYLANYLYGQASHLALHHPVLVISCSPPTPPTALPSLGVVNSSQPTTASTSPTPHLPTRNTPSYTLLHPRTHDQAYPA